MTTATSPNEPLIAAPTVWVVEDSLEDFAVLKRALTRSGPVNGLEHFERAERALEAIQDAEDLPDLMIVDLNLPGIDGVEFVRRVRATDDPRLQVLPICVLTSSTRTADRERSHAAGASGYRVKPRRASELGELAEFVRGLAQPAS